MSVIKFNSNETNENKISSVLLATNLTDLLSEKRISENELAKALDIPYNTIHRLTAGTTTDPRLSTLLMIADYLEVSLDQLIRNNYQPQSKQKGLNSPISIPVFTWENLQIPGFFDTVTMDSWQHWESIVLPKSQSLGKKAYGLGSRKSMHPRFPLGTLFIIDPDEAPVDGDLVLVNIKKKNEITLRDLVIDAPNWRLLPTVTGSETIIFDETLHTIIGIIVLTVFNARLSSIF